ncbi:MAG: PLP-dependent aminotransferase family protein [Christensenellales bacterium]|jgi:2-aminoadipate transaminase
MQRQFADRLDGITGSAIREIFKMLADPNIISFAGGNPDPSTFPKDALQEISDELLRTQGATVLQYGITEGWPALRESIARMVGRRGIRAQVENVLTLTGSSQGIDLLARIFLNPGDSVLVESPTFLGALQTFRTYQANLVPVEMDEEGILMDELERKMAQYSPKLLYIIPTFQNPSGRKLSLQRREKVARLAEKYGVVVVEDDPYGDLRYEGEALPAIKSFDGVGQVVHLLSFSKIISPGLRVGAAVGAPDILAKMVICKQGADTHTSNLSQAMVDAYIRRGGLEQHIEQVCVQYKEKRDVMLEKLDELGIVHTVPQGGLFIWCELERGKDAKEVLKDAVDRGVAFIPGTHFYAAGGYENTFRLNFSNATVEGIRRGMDLLAQCI